MVWDITFDGTATLCPGKQNIRLSLIITRIIWHYTFYTTDAGEVVSTDNRLSITQVGIYRRVDVLGCTTTLLQVVCQYSLGHYLHGYSEVVCPLNRNTIATLNNN
jgi:hypothetical protein